MSLVHADRGSGSILDFLDGGGEMGALIRGKDWSATPLGPPESWGQPLRIAVRLMLNSGHPMYIFWGGSGPCLYNDAYRRSIGPERHPSSLGQPATEVWAEIWDIIGPKVDHVMAGNGATWSENELVPITRDGQRQDVYWTYSYNPIDDGAAPHGVGGVLVICSETTDQMMLERRLADEKARQQQLFEGAPGFICILHGPDHVYEFVNHAYNELFGGRAYLGKSVREAFPELEGQVFYDLLDKVFTTGERHIAQGVPIRMNYPGRPAREHILDFIYVPTRDEEGRITGIFCEGHDVTDTHLSRGAVLGNERRQTFLVQFGDRLREVADPAGIMPLAARLLGEFLDADRAGFATIGSDGSTFSTESDWTADGMSSLAGTHRLDDFGPGLIEDLRAGRMIGFADSDVDPSTAGLQDVYRAAQVRAAISVPLTKEGRFVAVLYVHSRSPRRWTADEELLVQDVAERGWVWFERARAEAALRASEERLRALTTTLMVQVADRNAALRLSEASMRAIFETSYQYKGVLALDGTVLDVNVTALRGIASTLDAVVGKPFWETRWFSATPGIGDTVRAAIGKAAIGIEYRIEMHVDLPIGWRWLEFALRPIRSADGAVFAIVAEALDVTDRRRAEEALRQSQKLEAMGQLTGGVAHDFNNLLTPIIGSLDLLQRRAFGGDREQRLIGGALQSAERAKTLVQRLLAFARRQPLQPEPIDIAARVRGMLDLIGSTVGPRVQIELRLANDLPAARADANQLEMALLNLSVNARDAMPDGGRLSIAAQVESVGGDGPHDLQPGDYIRLSVRDTGVGMDEATLARAIEPFFSTKGIGQGTGLGLSMVHGLASQLGGAMVIASAPGSGTTVELWLPVSTAAFTAGTRAVPTVAARPTAGTALLVDDEELVRASTADMLVELGYRVVEAASSLEALGVIDGEAAFDLLVTDHLMPGLTGAALAAACRKRRPNTPILVISGYSEIEGIPVELPRLTKPFRLSELAETLASLGQSIH